MKKILFFFGLFLILVLFSGCSNKVTQPVFDSSGFMESLLQEAGVAIPENWQQMSKSEQEIFMRKAQAELGHGFSSPDMPNEDRDAQGK